VAAPLLDVGPGLVPAWPPQGAALQLIGRAQAG
jgi:hypothetical protein